MHALRGVLGPPLTPGKQLGAKYNVSSAQIGLGWIAQPAEFGPNGPMALVTKSS